MGCYAPAPPFLAKEVDALNKGIVFNEKLPIFQYREQILEAITSSPTVIIHGATGCGKTTQIPQYILESSFRKGEVPFIVVTQPRRIAAVSIAKHVCDERGWTAGGLIGFQIAQESEASQGTRILYCTLGIFLQQLVQRGNLNKLNISHVILDEVHEREEDVDLALLLIKKLQKTQTRCSLKLIVMSATMHMEKLTAYLGKPPVIEVESGLFDVKVHYLGDREIPSPVNWNSQRSSFELRDAYVQPFVLDTIVPLVSSFDHEESQRGVRVRGTVLIFVPGMKEIRVIMDRFNGEDRTTNKMWQVMPLHSSIGVREQREIFSRVPQSVRRIIVSTNIAESSITVPDIKYIVDLCLTKQLERAEGCSFTALTVTWASKSNCEQRKGRAGRVSAGTAFRLVPKEFYENLASHGVPEILRIPLHQTILKVKKLGIEGDIQEILLEALDPPGPLEIEKSVLELMEAGALTIAKTKDKIDGDLTPFGHIMSKLPLDIKLSRLIILSVCFGRVHEGIVLAACLSARSFLDTGFGKDADRYKMKMIWDRGQHSDLFAAVNAFQSWESQKSSFGSYAEERRWCETYAINCNRIGEVAALVQDLRDRVEQLDYLRFLGSEHTGKRSKWMTVEHEMDDMLVLQVIIAGAFYPSYFVSKTDRPGRGGIRYGPDDAKCVELYLRSGTDSQVYPAGVKKFFQKYAGVTPAKVEVKDRLITAVFTDSERAVPLSVYLAMKIRENRDVQKYIHPPALTGMVPRNVVLKETSKCPYDMVEVEGPTCPVEVRDFFGTTKDIEFRLTRVERSSVNCVVLNNAVEQRMQRLLVAATVSASQQDSKLQLDNTTLLRSQPGMIGLICMLFSPSVTLIPAQQEEGEERVFIGMRGGLGKTRNHPRRSLMKDHNFLTIFDTTFTQEQLADVYMLRELIKKCFSPELMDDAVSRQEKLPKLQKSVRSFFNLMTNEEHDFVLPSENSRRKTPREKAIELANLFPSWKMNNW